MMLIGIPWVELGRSLVGCDCYGLVKLYYSRLGVLLPDYTPDKNRDWILKSEESGFPALHMFEEVGKKDIQKNDIVWIKMFDPEMGGICNHLAVYVGDDNLLETTKGTGSVLVRLSRREKLIKKVFRYKGETWQE